MYNYLLIIHNLFRWIVILMAAYALYSNFVGWKQGGKYSKKDRALNSAFVGTMDLQLILGFLLYFFYSPYTKTAFSNMAEAMHDKGLRFWAVEHIAGMFIAIVVAHIGAALSKRAKTDAEKFKKAFIYFAIALILVVLSLPYAAHGGERPLNPFDHV